ncbi:hypothetical protein [Micropruina sp.]|uniref:hypothetical protein n=1 Tax=Micropruina sp. TaxID=2737536 RepID=UPI0039E2D9B8
MIREAVAALAALGPLPSDSQATTGASGLERWEDLADQVSKPLSDDEARALAASFPANDSDAFGTAWTLVHLLESAPGWPIEDALDLIPAYWRDVLESRLGRR